MLTLDEAESILLKIRPSGTTIYGRATYEGKHLFLAPWPDPLEGHLLPFFSVDPKTGKMEDFSPQDYDRPGEILALLNPPS